MTALLVLLGGAAGAVLRYLVDAALPPGRLPWATLLVNVAGAAGLGALTAGAAVPEWAGALAAAGFCGALSTWSALGHELLTLLRGGRRRVAAVLAVLHLTLGLLAAVAGAAAVG